MKKYNRMKIGMLLYILLCMMAFAGCGKAVQDASGLTPGVYEMALSMEGGTGKASIQSPCLLEVTEDGMFATLEWSSKHYDYMIVDGEKYLNLTPEGNSTFRVPIKALDEPIEMIGDTTAMSTPHEITYMVTIRQNTENAKDDIAKDIPNEGEGLTQNTKSGELMSAEAAMKLSSQLTPTRTVQPEYATGFLMQEYKGGYVLIACADDGRYLVVPEGRSVPEDLPGDIVPLIQPINSIYVASTSAMDMFASCGGLSAVKYSSISADSWSISKIQTEMENGNIEYAGKYSAPDYERLLAGGCDLAVENTMIYHSPQAKEQLIRNGIPVFMDYSNYEGSPLGRCEWVKVFASLIGNEEGASEAFADQRELYETAVEDAKSLESPLSVVYFYINSNGQPVVRSRDDYIAAMIRDAGGQYALGDLETEGGMSTVTMTMEDFYTSCVGADVMIYNSTIMGEVMTKTDLLEKCELLKDFTAFQKGNVYCSESNVYQASMEMGEIIREIGSILKECSGMSENADALSYFHKVKDE